MLIGLYELAMEEFEMTYTPFQKQILPRLMQEWGYIEEEGAAVALELEQTAPQVREAFQVWWATARPCELEIQGYTVARLMQEFQMNPIAAFLTLDWLLQEPESALAALTEGYDVIM